MASTKSSVTVAHAHKVKVKVRVALEEDIVDEAKVADVATTEVTDVAEEDVEAEEDEAVAQKPTPKRLTSIDTV